MGETTRINVTISKAEKEHLQRRAVEESRSMAAQAAYYIRTALAAAKSADPQGGAPQSAHKEKA